eukprot:comp17340_c0_seq3/m.16574 comp17340_c0_seq3/g.16574  ORF comp17340_c0_seq3/g.16574 comp17340_c0_seq3/m.16574 type:complete len:220 (-) comp17340_c0_seq3:1075-1734(-)
MQFRASSRLRWPRLLFSLARRRTLVDYDTISTIGNIPGSSIDQFILCKKHAAAGVCTCEGGETSWVVEATPAKNRRELKLFQTFLASEYSSETLSFVCRARAYQKSPTATVRDFIIDTYVKEGAPQQINLCDETRRHLCRLASSAFVDADLFEPAVRHCSVCRVLDRINLHSIDLTDGNVCRYSCSSFVFRENSCVIQLNNEICRCAVGHKRLSVVGGS